MSASASGHFHDTDTDSHSCSATETIVEIRDLSFHYGEQPILEGVNLAITRGAFLSIIGPNGGGKTTLLKLILGLLNPSSGSVKVFGAPPHKVRSRFGYVPQHFQFDRQFPVTVFDVVLMGCLTPGRFGFWKNSDRIQAEKALVEVGMEYFRDRKFSDLSGGQAQRVLIARALASEPELLLLDEPTANVDSEASEDFYALLKVLNRRMTVLLVTHDLGFVSELVREVICVSRQVRMHPVDALQTGDLHALYGHGVKPVHHNHAH